jgi:TRAP-type mannitol/chloroaromatic compound transport system permease large subunit
MIALLIVILLIGTPLFIVIACNALLRYHAAGIDLSALVIDFYGLAETPIILAIPLFTLAGYLLSASKAPARLVRLTNGLLGWMPGGLAIVTLITSALFAAFTGVSGINIIALGALLYPALVQARYTDPFGLGLIHDRRQRWTLIAVAAAHPLRGDRRTTVRRSSWPASCPRR